YGVVHARKRNIQNPAFPIRQGTASLLESGARSGDHVKPELLQVRCDFGISDIDIRIIGDLPFDEVAIDQLSGQRFIVVDRFFTQLRAHLQLLPEIAQRDDAAFDNGHDAIEHFRVAREYQTQRYKDTE